MIEAAGLAEPHVESGERTNGPEGHPAIALRGEARLDGRPVRFSYLEWRCLQRARTYGALVVSEPPAADAGVANGWTGHDDALLAVRCHGPPAGFQQSPQAARARRSLLGAHALERFAVRFAAAFHRQPVLFFARLWHTLFVETILIPFFIRRLTTSGLERLRDVSPDTPTLVVANHRTYFDLFAIFWVLRRQETAPPDLLPGPLRLLLREPARPLDLRPLLRLRDVPAIFRKGRARAFNAHAIDLLTEELRTPRRMVGFHPEGTRSKSESPYDMLPAKRGAGELVLSARPVVIPVFISGLKNSLSAELADSLRWRPRRPIRLAFGAPIDPRAFAATSGSAPSPAEAQACSDALMAAIAALAEEQRRAIASGARPVD